MSRLPRPHRVVASPTASRISQREPGQHHDGQHRGRQTRPTISGNFPEHVLINGIVDLARVVSYWAHETKSASDLAVIGALPALLPDWCG